MSLDFAMQGVSTLWGSFELKNEVILSNMLYQISGQKVDESEAIFNHWANELEKLPLYFQSFFGSTELNKVLSLIDYSIYAYDVAHIILDNLQFMLSGQGRGFERFEIQDDLIAKLRKIATERNVHITLVIHPKKTEDNQDLHVSSIFGTSKSTQEADNIIIIQNRNKYKLVDIKKNRFDGEVGKAAVIFDKELKKFYQINNSDTEKIYNGIDPYEIIKIRRHMQKDVEITSKSDEKKYENNYEMLIEPSVSNNSGFDKYKSYEIGQLNSKKQIYNDELISNKIIYKQENEELRMKNINSIQSMNYTYFGNVMKNENYESDKIPGNEKAKNFHDQEDQELIAKMALEEEKVDNEKNNMHTKWTIDTNNDPNFFKEGDVLYTYDDIINELASKNSRKNNTYGQNSRKGRQTFKDIEDELLENLDR